MATNNIIKVKLFGKEIGRIGLDENQNRSSFQYHPDYLSSNDLSNIFPATGIIKRVREAQLFGQYNNETFKGLPPQFADSLPDMFGSLIFKAWLDAKHEKEISVLEQLAYVANRGMGALEYSPAKEIPKNATIDLNEIIQVLKEVLNQKKSSEQKNINSQALINIFKIGTSAGGARPKILISEHKETRKIIPGDLVYANEYKHYLVKLAMDEADDYPREIVEYCYYLLLKMLNIKIMDSKLIDQKHFATLRFDRQNGEKQHVLTATGLTGWDYKDPKNSSYENLFSLCSFLKISHAELEELYKRMVFNVVFGNTDDHLKNHSFIYNPSEDNWNLAPAYDVTYALNPMLQFRKTNRALSINGKRNGITLADLLKIAQDFTIKNPKGIIKEVQSVIPELAPLMSQHAIPKAIIEQISAKIKRLK